jgi:hypothetical protein
LIVARLLVTAKTAAKCLPHAAKLRISAPLHTILSDGYCGVLTNAHESAKGVTDEILVCPGFSTQG